MNCCNQSFPVLLVFCQFQASKLKIAGYQLVKDFMLVRLLIKSLEKTEEEHSILNSRPVFCTAAVSRLSIVCRSAKASGNT